MLQQLSNETNRWPPNTKINNQTDWVETTDTMCSIRSPYFHFSSFFVIYLPEKEREKYFSNASMILSCTRTANRSHAGCGCDTSNRSKAKAADIFRLLRMCAFHLPSPLSSHRSLWASTRRWWVLVLLDMTLAAIRVTKPKILSLFIGFHQILWIFFGCRAKTKTSSLSIHLKNYILHLFFTFDFSL